MLNIRDYARCRGYKTTLCPHLSISNIRNINVTEYLLSLAMRPKTNWAHIVYKATCSGHVLGFSLRGVPLCSATTLHSPHCHISQELPQALACCRGYQSSQRPTEDKRGDLPYASECLAQIPAPRRDGGLLGHQCVPSIEYSCWPVMDNQYLIDERTGVWDEVGIGRKWGRGRKIKKREGKVKEKTEPVRGRREERRKRNKDNKTGRKEKEEEKETSK